MVDQATTATTSTTPSEAAEVVNQAGISLRNVYKIFGTAPETHLAAVKAGMSKQELLDTHNHVVGLRDISLEIRPGEIQVVMGLSGSGKSTLIRHINRLIEPTSGSIVINGRNVLEMNEIELRDFRRQHTAMVFQRFAPLPHRWVIDNVTFGLEIRRFIKDVNHGRFLKVEAVMERGASFDGARRVTLPSGTTLDVAAKELTNSASDSAVVTDSEGKPVGVISLRQITAALSSAVDAA